MEQVWAWLLVKLQEQPGLPILALLALAAWAYWRSQARAQQNQSKGLCARCGGAPATVTLQDLERPIHVCESCASLTRRTHSAVYYAFSVMEGLLIAAFCAIAVTLLSDSTSADWRILLPLGLIVAGNLAVLLRMRKARQTMREKRGAAQQ